VTHPHQEPESVSEGLDISLASYDVHIGYPEERASLALRLAGNGFTVADLAKLERVIGFKKANKGALMISQLKDLDVARKRIDDVTNCAAIKARRHEMTNVYEAGEDCNQRKAYALVRVDKKTPASVADLIGVSIATVNKWVEAERHLRYGDDPIAKKLHIEEDTRSRADRLRDFKEFIAQKNKTTT